MNDMIPDNVRELLGRSKSRVVDVTARDILRFIDAIGAPPPADRDDPPAPPLFFQSLAYEEAPLADLPPDGSPLELDVPVPATRAVGGSSAFEIHRKARAGDRVSVTTTLKDVFTKQGRSGPLYFVVVETEFRDMQQALLARETATYIKKGDA